MGAPTGSTDAANMSPRDSQVAHLLELLESLGGVTARSMFGGYGFFRDGAMLGLIFQKVFYVRVDDETRLRHEALGLAPFVYVARGGKRMVMPYFEVPPEALDDAEEMRRWAEPATRAAAAAKAKTKTKAKAKQKPKPKAKAKPGRKTQRTRAR